MFFWENGFNLKERLVPQGLSNAASAAVEALKINSITEKLCKGRPAVLKRRNVPRRANGQSGQFLFSHLEHSDSFPEQSQSVASLGDQMFQHA